MPQDKKRHDPWLLAVWPGMGQVTLAAGYCLLAKLGMYLLAEFSSLEVFDVEHIEVRIGCCYDPSRRMRSTNPSTDENFPTTLVRGNISFGIEP